MIIRTKQQIVLSPTLRDQKRKRRERGMQWGARNGVFYFLERERARESHFSLDLRAIRPSDFFGARRKAVLRGEGNAWAPVYWSFDKLREVGVLSYLFYPLFKCFVMLVLV